MSGAGAAGEYEHWREHLAAAGVEIVHDSDRSDRARSSELSDPAGNPPEIAGSGFWPSLA